MRGSLTSQSPVNARLLAPTGVAFRHHGQRRHSDSLTCRGSIPRLHVLLSTLHISLSTQARGFHSHLCLGRWTAHTLWEPHPRDGNSSHYLAGRDDAYDGRCVENLILG